MPRLRQVALGILFVQYLRAELWRLWLRRARQGERVRVAPGLILACPELQGWSTDYASTPSENSDDESPEQSAHSHYLPEWRERELYQSYSPPSPDYSPDGSPPNYE